MTKTPEAQPHQDDTPAARRRSIPTADPTRLERTGRAIVAGTWGCAGIVMVGSAINAVLTFGGIGDNRVLGLATGVAVDIALCVALIGDRRLYVHGLSSNWGRALRVTAALMSLVLNAGLAVRDGHFFAAGLHAFLPILLVFLTESGQDYLLKFTGLTRSEGTNTRQAEPDKSRIELDQLKTALGVATARAERAEQATALALAELTRTMRLTSERDAQLAAEPVSPDPRASGGHNPAPHEAATPAQRKAWVREQRSAGHNPAPSDVDKHFGPPRNGARIIREVDQEPTGLRAVAAGNQ